MFLAKFSNAISALASAVQTETTIRRNGKKVRVNSTELVPADLRLVEVKNLQVNESALTGESSDVHGNSVPINYRIYDKKESKTKNDTKSCSDRTL
jgi:cation-transporting P-type ATPase F